MVLEWTNPGCPFVQKHYKSQNMQALQKNWTGKNVVWLAINPPIQVIRITRGRTRQASI